MPLLNHHLTGPSGVPTVLFLHGFMGSSADWTPTVTALQRTVRCLTVDLPGHGGSLHLPDDAYTLEGATRALRTLLDDLDLEAPIILGYSMGGRLALYFCTRYPDRCSRLILESASPGLESEEARSERREVDHQRAACIEEDLAGFLHDWYDMPLFGSLKQHDLVQDMIATRLQNDPEELGRALRGMSVGQQPNLWPELAALDVPTLALTGKWDDKYAATIRRMEALRPTLQTTLVPRAGHNVHAERPKAFLQAMRDFLPVTA